MKSWSCFEFKWWRTDFFFNNSRPKLHDFLSCLSFVHFWWRAIKNRILILCHNNSFPLIWLKSKWIYSFLSIKNMKLLRSWGAFYIIEIWNIWIIWKFTLILVSPCRYLLRLKSTWLKSWIVLIVLIYWFRVIKMISIG